MRTLTAPHVLGFASLVALSACNDSSGDPSTQTMSSSLCPTCAPSAGGETADFPSSIGEPPCHGFELQVPISAEEARSLGVVDPERIERVTKPIDAPFSWTLFEPNEYVPHPFTRVLGGFASSTTLHLRTTIVAYRQLSPDPAHCTDSNCHDNPGDKFDYDFDFDTKRECNGVALDLQTTVDTDDGAVHGVVTSTMSIRPGLASEDGVYAEASLQDVTGSLDLASSDAPPVRGYLGLRMKVGDNGITGAVGLALVYDVISETVVAPDGGPSPSHQREAPIWGEFIVGPRTDHWFDGSVLLGDSFLPFSDPAAAKP
ncbi:MAG: hypothetical protein QM778_31425 [Myxococcales bacterium]